MNIEESRKASLENYKNGYEHFNANDFEKAIDFLTKAIDGAKGNEKEQSYDLASAYYFRALSFISIDKLENAIEDASKAHELKPEEGAILFHRATAYRLNGNEDKALEDYKKVKEIDPEIEEVAENCIDLINKVKVLKEKIAAEPDNHENYRDLGDIHYNNEEFKYALKYYLQAVDKNPKDIQSVQNIAELYFKLNEYPEAIKFYNKTLEIDNNHTDALFGRACSYAESHKLDKAEKDFSRVIEIDPTAADAHRKRGELYLTKEDFSKAAFDLTAAALMCPDKYLEDLKEQVKFGLKDGTKEWNDFAKLLDSFIKEVPMEGTIEASRVRKINIPEDAKIKINNENFSKADFDKFDDADKNTNIYNISGEANQHYSTTGMLNEVDSRYNKSKENGVELSFVVKDDKTGEVIFRTKDVAEIKTYLNIEEIKLRDRVEKSSGNMTRNGLEDRVNEMPR